MRILLVLLQHTYDPDFQDRVHRDLFGNDVDLCCSVDRFNSKIYSAVETKVNSFIRTRFKNGN